VDDVPAGEVQGALAGPEAAAPQQEGVNGTKITQTLNLIRPTTLPMKRIGVMAANTNWK
jgi:hypothetical protein